MLQSAVSSVHFTENAVEAVIGNHKQQFDHIFWTGNSHTFGNALVSDSRCNELSQLLKSFRYTNVAVTNVGFDSEVLPESLKSFGLLANSQEPLAKEGLLGISFDSCIFPSPNQTKFTVMMGGERKSIEKMQHSVWDGLSRKALREILV